MGHRAALCDGWHRVSQEKPRDVAASLEIATFLRSMAWTPEAEQMFSHALYLQKQAGVVNRTTILSRLSEWFDQTVYLEIGVARGTHFLQVPAHTKIGIDPNFTMPGGHRDGGGCYYFSMSSDDFFANPPNIIKDTKIDLIFVDGLHTYQQSLRDVLTGLSFLAPNGMIVLHDCLPENEAEAAPTLEQAQSMAGFEGFWTGDIWKTIVYLRTFHPELSVNVIHADHGIGLVMPRGSSSESLHMSKEDIDALTFHDLQDNLADWLNLMPASWFETFVKRYGPKRLDIT